MAVYFQLFAKGSETPAKFSQIDDAIRAHFGAEPSDTEYFCGWYDIIGYLLATGRDFETVHRYLVDQEFDPILPKICEFMAENYSANSWFQR